MFINDIFKKKLNEDGSDAKSYMQTDRGAVPPKTATDKPMDSKPAQEPKTKKDPKDYLIKNEQVQQYNPKGVPIKTAQAAPAPINVPKGWEAKTQADGSTRISKQGSIPSDVYKQNMADYKAKNWTPEKIADYGQRMASGQGYTDAERSANYQQQQQHFGQYADKPLDEAEPTNNQPRTGLSAEQREQLRKDIDAVDYNKQQQPPAAPSSEQKAGIRRAVSDYNKEKVREQDLERSPYPPEKDFPNWYDMRDREFEVHQNDGTIDFIQPGTDEWNEIYDREFPDHPRPDNLRDVYSDGNPVAEGKADPTGSWVVYDGGKVKRFKSHDGAKAYAAKNGGKVASSEFYADKIQKQGVAEGFDDLDRFMKAKYGPKPSGGSGIKRGTYGQPGRARGRKKGELSGAFHQGGGSDIPHNVDFDRSHSERSAGRRMPRFSDDYDSVKRSEVDENFDDKSPHSTYVQSIRTLTNKDGDENYKHRVASLSTDKSGNQRVRALDTSREFGDELTINANIPKGVTAKIVPQQGNVDIDEGSVQDKLHKRHQELRKKRGAPDPDYYKELKKTYDMPDDERWARTAELKKKYQVTNEDRERYIEALGRAGYEIVNERRMTCPECGGAAYEDRMLAEKQDACYHKVKSRYKVWPSAYASGALVRCRKKGAANWGNKSKK
jgi:hypothetical protein